MSVKPISPEEVPAVHAETIPDEVIEAFNEMIVEKWSPTTRRAKFTQNAVMDRILCKFGLDKEDKQARTNKRNELYERHHLDIEDLFRAEGWTVKYDKPAYNETYAASFEFISKRS